MRVPCRQARSPQRAPAPWGASDHPPTTNPTDGEVLRTDWHWLLFKLFTKNNNDMSKKKNMAVHQQWIKHRAVTPIWLLRVDIFFPLKKKNTQAFQCMNHSLQIKESGWVYMQQIYWTELMWQERQTILRHLCFSPRQYGGQWQLRQAEETWNTIKPAMPSSVCLNHTQKAWGLFRLSNTQSSTQVYRKDISIF